MLTVNSFITISRSAAVLLHDAAAARVGQASAAMAARRRRGSLPACTQPPKLLSRLDFQPFLGCVVSRDLDPVPGQWYENLEEEESFQVLSVDEDSELIEVQYVDGDVEELDLEYWAEMDLEKTAEPEGWSGSATEEEEDEEEEEEEDEDDDDWDDDDDDDDDWDDDEDERDSY
jgi:hypothetical protein